MCLMYTYCTGLHLGGGGAKGGICPPQGFHSKVQLKLDDIVSPILLPPSHLFPNEALLHQNLDLWVMLVLYSQMRTSYFTKLVLSRATLFDMSTLNV